MESTSWPLCKKHQDNPDPNINAFGIKVTQRMLDLKPGDFLPTGDINEIGCQECFDNARAAFPPAEPLKLGKSHSMVYDSKLNHGEGGWRILD